MLAPTRGQRDQRSFLLQRAQPAMAGLIDGSLSTLAPIFASATASYLASHLSPATLVHGRPAPSLIGMSLIHGYTTGFWVAAAIFGAGAVICGTLFRFGPLRAPAPAEPVPAETAEQASQAPAMNL